MQEEVENKVVVLMENCSKFTARELKQALAKVLQEAKAEKTKISHSLGQHRENDAAPHGQMSVKDLAAQDRGMQSIEVTDENIGSFNRIARKYGIDFAPFKVKGEDKYLVFFKAPDTDAMTAAFQEYTRRQVQRAGRPSVLARLQHIKQRLQNVVKDKIRHKEPER